MTLNASNVRTAHAYVACSADTLTASRRADFDLKKRLERYTQDDPDYWSFRGNSKRRHGHDYFQYPGMMVPQMLGTLLDELLFVHPEIRRVTDPFVGSGTTLTEAMLRGLNFSGSDINPIAILLCKTKAQQDSYSIIQQEAARLLHDIELDVCNKIEADFPGLNKWFEKQVRTDLSKIRRAIRQQSSLACRRFFWVVMAETVRLTSNSRTSTYKLHVRTPSNIRERKFSAISVFQDVMQSNLASLEMQQRALKASMLAQKNRYLGSVCLRLEDAVTADSLSIAPHDLLLTSPPYGDNKTTIPYGQASYLPLQWIDLKDIDQDVDPNCLATTAEIDSRSLGGSRKKVKERRVLLEARSESFRTTMNALENQPSDRIARITAFCADLDSCLPNILARLKPSSIMVWTVGNRRVGGVQVPVDNILIELLENYGAYRVVTLSRNIVSKRMASKNRIASTMDSEKILVMRTAGP